ncbi:MAG TPA: serine hydrolase domain-containing protein, partial [Vulgatibacter sp.]|nr:serine hydrolase domain-containing protein [Vulgatibacter sp.]
VIADGRVLHASAHGRIPAGPTTADTRFDVASLTKVMATTTLAHVLLSRGTIDLDDRAIEWLPELAGSRKEDIRVRHLLGHSSGLPAWRPLFLEPGASGARRIADEVEAALADPDEAARTEAIDACRRRVLDAAAATPLERQPGEGRAYSDLGFILLGELLARAAGIPLERACAAAIFRPLGLEATAFRPLAAGRPATPPEDVAPTGRRRPRPPAPGQEELVPETVSSAPSPAGEVDDDNAWAIGGVAGHAGVFSTAIDVARWGAAIVAERAGAGTLGDPAVLDALLRTDPTPGPPRALGFDLPSEEDSCVGRRFGRAGPQGAAGHLGFTGTSVWIDFDRRIVVSLLTNRTFPDRANAAGIRAVRPALHDAVLDALC